MKGYTPKAVVELSLLHVYNFLVGITDENEPSREDCQMTAEQEYEIIDIVRQVLLSYGLIEGSAEDE